jgi:hypothetical protein
MQMRHCGMDSTDVHHVERTLYLLIPKTLLRAKYPCTWLNLCPDSFEHRRSRVLPVIVRISSSVTCRITEV